MISGFCGLTTTTCSVGELPLVTVSTVDPLTDPDVALIVLVPIPTAAAKPPLLTVATPVVNELQVTDVVMFFVLESLYVPVAVNCCVVPF